MRAFDTVMDSQRTFRVLLEALSRPGKVMRLPENRDPAEAVARTLLDGEVSLLVSGEGAGTVGGRLFQATGSRPAPVEEADFALFLDGSSGGAIGKMKTGTLEAPEDGATAVYLVRSLSPEGGELTLELDGPGVRGTQRLGVSGFSAEEIVEIRASRAAYPLGVDVYLVDGDGHVVGLPRSTRIGVVS